MPKKPEGRQIDIPEMAKIAMKGVQEMLNTQIAVARGDAQTQATVISKQMLKDLGLDDTKFDYQVNFATGKITELPLGSVTPDAAPAKGPKLVPKDHPNPATRKS